MEALQQAAEDFLVDVFGDTVLCAVHAKRQKTQREDIQLANRLTEWWRKNAATKLTRFYITL